MDKVLYNLESFLKRQVSRGAFLKLCFGGLLLLQMAQDGVARCIRPAHTLYDGDTLFALATGEREADPSLVGALAAEATSRAILNAVYSATTAGGLPSAQDWKR